MLKSLKKLLGLTPPPPPPFDIEKAVGHYLLSLPRCTNRVLVVSCAYGDDCFDYELTVDTPSLAAWAVKHEKGCWSANEREQAARLTLPLWLQLADVNDNTVTRLPKDLFKILSGYHGTFLEMPAAQVFCPHCKKTIEGRELAIETSDLGTHDGFNRSHYEMHCPHGHLLYKKTVERRPIHTAYGIPEKEALLLFNFLRGEK